MIQHGNLRKALLDWMEWFRKFSKELIPRNDIPAFPSDLCLALIGVRRSGKTSTAVQIGCSLSTIETIFYFNFEDPVFFSGGDVSDIEALITIYEEEMGTRPNVVVLDEIHNVVGWERWVRKAVDTGSYKVIVTGSSSKLLSSEIATAISGRVIEHTIWPLSFKEYVTFKQKAPSTEGLWLREFENYLRWGGFPKAVLLNEDEERALLLKQYLSDIVLRDVVARHTIKNQHGLNQLVTWYLTNLSCLHSYTAIRKAFGMSIEMISTFSNYLAQAFLAFEMTRYHPNLKVQVRDPKKVYIVDPGIRTVSLRYDREDWGRLAENAVYIELRRRGKEIFYYKNEKEVDFILTELGKPIQAIQVAYTDLEDAQTKEREISALLECMGDLKLHKGIILTRALEHTETIRGHQVKYIPLYRWLAQG